jgi:hypothetical protein
MLARQAARECACHEAHAYASQFDHVRHVTWPRVDEALLQALLDDSAIFQARVCCLRLEGRGQFWEGFAFGGTLVNCMGSFRGFLVAGSVCQGLAGSVPVQRRLGRDEESAWEC